MRTNPHSGPHDSPGPDDQRHVHVIYYALWLVPTWFVPLWPTTRRPRLRLRLRLRLRRCRILGRLRSPRDDAA